jgi:hypothetical protein
MDFALFNIPSIPASGTCAKGCVIMLESPSDEWPFQPATQKSRRPFNGTAVKDGSTPETTDVTAFHASFVFPEGA